MICTWAGRVCICGAEGGRTQKVEAEAEAEAEKESDHINTETETA